MVKPRLSTEMADTGALFLGFQALADGALTLGPIRCIKGRNELWMVGRGP